MAGLINGGTILEGRLILSLDSGEILDLGYVQGPQGLKGDRGGIGSVGPKGQDGRTIHHGTGFPTMSDPATAVDGDFFYSTDKIAFFGPRTGGQWGKPVYLRPQDNKSFTLPTGMKSQGSRSSGRAFAASMGGPGGGGGAIAPTGDGLDLINGHNKPLAANINSIIASDTKGDAMHVLVKADATTGSWYGEVIVTHFGPQADYTVAWEVNIGTAPKITFAPVWNVDHLDLGLSSSVALTNLRGKVIYV